MSNTEALTIARPGKPLRLGLWAAQALVFLGFGFAGASKLLEPIPQLAAKWPWTGELPSAVVRLLGVIDIAGGVGVLIPALIRIWPGLTVPAAFGCVVLQICAMIFHIARGEIAATPVNLLFLALAAFILWGRRKVPILPR